MEEESNHPLAELCDEILQVVMPVKAEREPHLEALHPVATEQAADLIEKLQKVVHAQYTEADRALLGYGDFVLHPEYARHHPPTDAQRLEPEDGRAEGQSPGPVFPFTSTHQCRDID